ncbi:hypothetical protein IKQ21_08895 [bacterium]|nr:hypothetical protein [bacterium]
MECPKCKNQIDDGSLKCSNCGARVASVCKDCGHINPITAVECCNCHKILLKICDNCKAANLPDASQCRKCGNEFTATKTILSAPEYTAQYNSQQKVKTKIIDALKDAKTRIITVTGESGSGKNLVLRYAISDLSGANLIWLHGNCSQITQLSPFGYFQDVLLSFFNVNNFCADTLQLKKNSIKFFKQDFPSLSNSEILDLLNFLYPEILDKYENIYKNKAKMFLIMKKVILTIIEKVKAVFIIDNFENIDGMSYDFIQELLKDDTILERCKFIILSRIIKPGLGCITSPKLDSNNYVDLTIAPFTESQTEALVCQYQNFKYDKVFINDTFKLSSGNPALIEQMVLFYKDLESAGLKVTSVSSAENLVKMRLEILKKTDLPAYRTLSAMSILGVKFYPAMLEHFDNNNETEFERIIETLVQKGFINQINNLAFEFKSYNIWKIIISILKEDESFEDILNILYETLSIYKQSSIALLGYIVQKLNNNDRSFDIWTLLMKQASYIGDIGLYIIAQKQALKLIEHKANPFYTKVRKNIYTRVGKLLEPIDHNAAFEYLQNAVMMLEDDEDYEHIELLGYLASASMKNGNYWGAIECAENVLNKLPDDMELEKALVKSREIKPLVKLGNYGQAVNLVDTEIMPVFEKYLGRGKNCTSIDLKKLYELWLEVYFDFAEALTFQGDSRMFDIIKLIFDIIEKNKVTDVTMLCKANLALALANTIKGDIKTSEKILDDILKEFSLDSMNQMIVSRWNFIDIVNKFISKDYDSLYTELFNVAAFANNINDNFTKNILKTLLAKMLKDKNDARKALEILEEQVSYFAKEKVATGVLLSWYLIAETKLITSGSQFALDIATKALDIAQSPSINNYYFISLFNKLIGEIYIAKQDFESANVYLEKAIFIAKQFKLDDLLVRVYLQYAKMYQELALPKTSKRTEYIRQSLKMFQEAKNVEIVNDHQHLQKKIREELSVLTSFCKLNGIALKKSSK